MDGRYSGSYGNWNADSSGAGYDDYGYGQGSGSNYGYGGKSWDSHRGNAGQNSESIVAKINQRLDLLSHNDTDEQERFAPFESYDSRSSLDDRDLFRSGFDYSEYGPNRNDSYGGRFDRFDYSTRNRRDYFRYRGRDGSGKFRGQNWSRDWMPNNRPYRNDSFSSSSSERLSACWNEMSYGMGGRGYAAPPRNLPSLFSQALTSGYGPYGMQGMGKQFGGLRQRRRDWNRFRGRRGRGGIIGGMKRKQSTGSNDEPDFKMSRTDQSDYSDSEEEREADDDDVEDAAAGDACASFEDKDSSDSPEKEKKETAEGEDNESKKSGDLQEEASDSKKKLYNKEKPKKKQRDRITERIMYVCSVCKFRTFDDDEIFPHLESKFHKENFKFIGTKLPKQTAEFLHEYILNKNKKTLKFRDAMEDKNAIKKRIQEQNLLHGISIDNFMKKVEAVHCTACEMFIPMQYNAIQRHMKAPDHNRNRKMMLEQSKRSGLQVAKSILNNRNIVSMLDKYLQGENPFTEDAKDDEDGVDDPMKGDGLNQSIKCENDGDKGETPEAEGAEDPELGAEGSEGGNEIVNAPETVVEPSEREVGVTEEPESSLTADQDGEESLPAGKDPEVSLSVEDEENILEVGAGENPDESSPGENDDAEESE
ncbi:A-kinase anchor protein 8-like isoform X2 [Pristis pectinata]|uniref:A-kinase anchor protein 8-like isoform X2 n=1 Tax=Pristis pectinata TaxID=685728 RepID=UPI00223D718F|nr:A-kinase anchor protein 8-like isoform X2 [Pristis pectinata]